jgi:peptidoglycan/LPS O-acetylase OafA/YrhL
LAQQKIYFEALTGLRYIAAVFVFIHHFTPKWLPVRLYNFFGEFHIGVSIFFVLSGFLICYRYDDGAELNKSWFKNYFLNRVARIYPMYFLITLLPVIIYHEGFKIFLLNISFLRGFFKDFIFTGVWQGWSLTVEECFYLLAPIVFLLRKRIWLWLMCVVIILSGLAITAFFKDNNWHGFMGDYKFMWSFTFFGRCVEFFAGVQLALLVKSPSFKASNKISFTYAGITGILLTAFLISLFKENFRWGIESYGGIFLNNFILPVFICSLLYGLLKEESQVKNFLSLPALQLLGKASYCFYLVHLGVLHKFIYTTITDNFFAELLLTSLISVLLFKLIEDPLNKILRANKLWGLLK